MGKLGLGAGAVILAGALLLAWLAMSTSTHANRTTLGESPDPAVSTGSGLATSEPTQEGTATALTEPSGGLDGLPSTSDPDEYAKAIAAAVFAQDTVTTAPEDHRARLMSQADPLMSARGRADLERMVAERIPTPEQWQRMRANDQWSQWTTDDVWQPGAWDEVVTSGQAEPGWALRNVLGQQTVHFLDGGVQRATSRERTLTVGMRCPATGAAVDRCWLTLVGIGVVS